MPKLGVCAQVCELGLAMRLFLLMRIDAHQMRASMRINRINSKKNHLFLTKFCDFVLLIFIPEDE